MTFDFVLGWQGLALEFNFREVLIGLAVAGEGQRRLGVRLVGWSPCLLVETLRKVAMIAVKNAWVREGAGRAGFLILEVVVLELHRLVGHCERHAVAGSHLVLRHHVTLRVVGRMVLELRLLLMKPA